MKGFKDFVMRGNLVEIAVAFIIATAFADVVKTFTAMLLDLIGKIFATPNFSSYVPAGIHVGAFITAVIAFVILAAVVYLGVVRPYELLKARFTKPIEDAAEAADESVVLLREIRDALRAPRV